MQQLIAAVIYSKSDEINTREGWLRVMVLVSLRAVLQPIHSLPGLNTTRWKKWPLVRSGSRINLGFIWLGNSFLAYPHRGLQNHLTVPSKSSRLVAVTMMKVLDAL